jgi:hypothetical protein
MNSLSKRDGSLVMSFVIRGIRSTVQGEHPQSEIVVLFTVTIASTLIFITYTGSTARWKFVTGAG